MEYEGKTNTAGNRRTKYGHERRGNTTHRKY